MGGLRDANNDEPIMKATRIILFASAIGLLSFASCEKNLLQIEQYKPVIFLKSGDNNILHFPHSLNDSISTGYITAGSGGSMPLTKDAKIRIQLDSALLNQYNYRNFGQEFEKYAKLLPSNCYVIPYLEQVIRAGDLNAVAFFPIEIDANRLSPDSTYMIPMKIASADGLEIREERNFVFYQVDLMNAYAAPGSDIYKMHGTKRPEQGGKSSITGNKKVVPLTRNKIRLFPENVLSSTCLQTIQDQCIVLAVQEDNSVLIRPYKNIQVEGLDGCSYDPGKKIFRIHYRYRLPGETKWITVFETLTRVE